MRNYEAPMRQLIDSQWYTLPDGTLLQARVPLIGSVRLHTQDDAPAYLYDAALGAWRRLVWNVESDGYTALPCDLVDDDVVLAQSPEERS